MNDGVLDSRGLWQRSAGLRLALAPFGLAYGLVMSARRGAYRRGLLRSRRAGRPVISIGNLTAGGTGKTPMVEWTVRRLLDMGRRPAILSRGYAGRGAANDEARLLARRLPDVPHLQQPDRADAARRAVTDGADCLVLDDGFQHLRLCRDLDIVLIDALDPFGGGRVLPAGTLREPPSCLSDADALVLTRADALDPAERAALRERLERRAPGRPVFEAAHRPTAWIGLDGSESRPTDALTGRKVFLFCGIGNPQGFLHTVRSLGAEVVAAEFLPDHCAYAEGEPERLAAACRLAGAECAVTTEKDAVKLTGRWPGPAPLRVLQIEMTILEGQDRLEKMMRTALK